MSALLLPLKPDVAKSPNSLHLGIVAAFMIFPDDEKTRNRAIERAQAQHYFEQFQAGTFPKERIGGLIKLALRAISLDDLEEISNEPHNHGYGAGMILYNALLKNERSESAPKTKALKEVAAALLQGRGNLKLEQAARTSSHPNKIIWETFKPVASFWAAQIMMGLRTPTNFRATGLIYRCFLNGQMSFLGSERRPGFHIESTRCWMAQNVGGCPMMWWCRFRLVKPS